MSRGTRSAIGLLLAALLSCSVAGAEGEPDLRAELIRRAAESGLTPEQADMMLQRADRTARANLPANLVFDRYLEGLAKGIPLDRIEAAVDQLEARLQESAQCVDQVYPPDRIVVAREDRLSLIDHCAHALAIGITTDGVARTMQLAAREQQGAVEGKSAVLAVSCLVGGGLEPDSSIDFVKTAWAHSFRGADLERLGKDLGSLSPDGQGPPPQVLQQIREMIGAGSTPDDVFRRLEMLPGLGGPPGPFDHPPGMGPGEDPSDMRGPGGPPDDPDHQGSGGDPPPPPPPNNG